MAKVKVLVRITGRNTKGGVYDYEKEIAIDLPADFVTKDKAGRTRLASRTVETEETV